MTNDTDTSAEAVERFILDYHHTQTYAEMTLQDDGEWVRFSDYAALAAERNHYKARAERAEGVRINIEHVVECLCEEAEQTSDQEQKERLYRMAESCETTLAQIDAETDEPITRDDERDLTVFNAPDLTLADAYREGLAAAYDNAASRVNQLSHTATATGNFRQASALANEAENIRDSTPSDAQAALQARDKRVREETLREAHDKIASMWASSTREHMDAILALIEKDKTDE
jgi:hypothetical protein